MAIHSTTLAWKIPWTEEPDRLQSMLSQRVGHDSVTSVGKSYQNKETSQALSICISWSTHEGVEIACFCRNLQENRKLRSRVRSD